MPTTVRRERDAARAESAAAPPEYRSGFANEFATRARCPARCRSDRTRRSAAPYGLYAERVSGTAFTGSRVTSNRRTWFCAHPPLAQLPTSLFKRIDEAPAC